MSLDALSYEPLIPQQRLKSARRILYMTHLAIGDFTFQGVYLKAIKQRYPHLSLDIWIDDCRESSKEWHKGRNKALGQWLESVDFIDQVYPIALNNSERTQLIQQAALRNYDIIVFIASQRTELYAKYARQISSQAYVVGSRSKWLSQPLKKFYYFSKLNGEFNLEKLTPDSHLHISEIYKKRFEKCFGPLLETGQQSATIPLHIDKEFTEGALHTLDAWSKTNHLESPRFVFVNHLSTTHKRDYSWQKLVSVMRAIASNHPHLAFVLNVPPNAFSAIKCQLSKEKHLDGMPVFLFTAANHFMELPALINECEFVISVETATMHLAAALKKKQLVLMREKAKSWKPTYAEKILYGDKRVDDIPAEKVIEAFDDILSKSPN